MVILIVESIKTTCTSMVKESTVVLGKNKSHYELQKKIACILQALFSLWNEIWLKYIPWDLNDSMSALVRLWSGEIRYQAVTWQNLSRIHDAIRYR